MTQSTFLSKRALEAMKHLHKGHDTLPSSFSAAQKSQVKHELIAEKCVKFNEKSKIYKPLKKLEELAPKPLGRTSTAEPRAVLNKAAVARSTQSKPSKSKAMNASPHFSFDELASFVDEVRKRSNEEISRIENEYLQQIRPIQEQMPSLTNSADIEEAETKLRQAREVKSTGQVMARTSIIQELANSVEHQPWSNIARILLQQ